MVSYVLLIIIALSMAITVYAWLRFYAPDEPKEECPAETALFVKDYSCDFDDKTILINMENKGLFSIDGFFIKGTNKSMQEEPDSPAIYALNLSGSSIYGSQDPSRPVRDGTFYFSGAGSINRFKPGDTKKVEFSYNNSIPLTKIQIQPFIEGEEYLLLCENIFTLEIGEEKNCE